jgi:hypothetical protein
MIDEPNPIFLDTSIQIARKVHRPEIQKSIDKRLRKHNDWISGLIVRQEFKKRLLKDANYLLKQLNERKSFQKVIRHISDSLPPAHLRKMKICLDLIMTVQETDTDLDLFDRARFMLRDLIKNGVATSEAHLRVNQASGCACALQPIIEKRPFIHYEFGKDKCSQFGDRCGIRAFLQNHRDLIVKLYEYLKALTATEKSKELTLAQQFIEKFLANSETIEAENPCLTVGDLLIALESEGCATFYTMNIKESRHLARALKQSMIYRSPNSDREEIEYLANASEWPPP